VKRVSGNDDGIITAAQGDIDTPMDGFADNSRLFLPPTAFNRFAVTRKVDDGLLASITGFDRVLPTSRAICRCPRCAKERYCPATARYPANVA
jgi:hypothetical protein